MQKAGVVEVNGEHTRAETARVSGVFVATREPPLSARLKRPLIAGAAALLDRARTRFTEDFQVHGGEWIQNRKPNEVYLWLATHQTTLDFMNLFSLQTAVPGRPNLRIASRTYGDNLAGRIQTAITSPVVFHLPRPNMGEGAGNEALRKKLDAEIERVLQEVRDAYVWGQHAMAFPEGTTMTPGSILMVRTRGLMGLSRVRQSDGSYLVVPTVPMGYTLDLLAAPWGKNKRFLNFVNVGTPMQYEPVKARPNETQEEYDKRDAITFANRVHRELVRLSTITTSQLGGAYLMAKVQRGEGTVRRGELASVIAKQAKAFNEAGYVMDDSLKNAIGREERTDALWANAVNLGYLRERRDASFDIDAARVMLEPIDANYGPHEAKRYRRYKHENPLRYCANRIIQVASQDLNAAAILELR